MSTVHLARRLRWLAVLGTALVAAAPLAACSSSPDRYDYATVLACMRDTGAQITEGSSRSTAAVVPMTGGVFHAKHSDYEGMDVGFAANDAQLASFRDDTQRSGDLQQGYAFIKKNVVVAYHPAGQTQLRTEIDACLP